MAVILSAVAGYVDTAGFLALFGLFTAHVTGDLVLAGTVVAERAKLGVGARLMMVPVFMISVAATALFARTIRRREGNALAAQLALMAGALAAFCMVGVILQPLASGPDASAVVLIGGTGVIAMGIQNTLMRDSLSGLSPTTIMTGNLTQFTIDLVEYAVPVVDDDERRARVRSAAAIRLLKFGGPLIGFVAGALISAWLTSEIGLLCISLPTAVVGSLAVAVWQKGRRLRTVAPEAPRSNDAAASEPTPTRP